MTRGELVVEAEEADNEGTLEPAPAGEVVMTLPAPESLSREPGEVRRVLAQAGPGTEPLVVEIEAAEGVADRDLAVLLEAARRAPRPVIVRVIRNA